MILVIARSEATKQSSFLRRGEMDCFVASLLAMTKERPLLLPQSGEAAEARQSRFAAQARESGQVRQALPQTGRKILWQRGHAARPGASRHFLGQRLHLLGRRHAAAKTHRLRDA